MKNTLKLVVALIIGAASANLAKAQFTITDSIGGTPNVGGATLQNFDGASPSILSLTGNAYLVTGGRGIPDYYTAPYFSGSTAAYFGETPTSGYDASQYVAVEAGGTATLTFSTPEVYLGLLWGSIDSPNLISFYNSTGGLIGTVAPSQLTGVTEGDGTDANGAAYVNIDSSVALLLPREAGQASNRLSLMTSLMRPWFLNRRAMLWWPQD